MTYIDPRSAAQGVGLRLRANAADSQVLIRIVFQEEARMVQQRACGYQYEEDLRLKILTAFLFRD